MREGRARLELDLRPSTITLLDAFAARQGFNRASAVSWLIRAEEAVSRDLRERIAGRCRAWQRHPYGPWHLTGGARQVRRCTRCSWRDVK